VLWLRQAVRQGQDRGEEALKASERELHLPLSAGRAQDPEPRRHRDGPVEQCGLAKTGFTQDEQCSAAPAARGFEEPVECPALACRPSICNWTSTRSPLSSASPAIATGVCQLGIYPMRTKVLRTIILATTATRGGRT